MKKKAELLRSISEGLDSPLLIMWAEVKIIMTNKAERVAGKSSPIIGKKLMPNIQSIRNPIKEPPVLIN